MSQKIKKVLAVTGIRSEYDILYPILSILHKDPLFDVRLVVSGAHLTDWHGSTSRQIKEDGFVIADSIDSFFMTDRFVQRPKSVGVLVVGLVQTVEREQPDVLLVIGDREESIATALVGNYMSVMVAHVAGGDTVFGYADDPIRFAVSKLAHIHFPFSQKSADNLKRVGEEEFRIFNAGNPALDRVRMMPEHTLQEVSDILQFDVRDGRYVVLLQHPQSLAWEDTASQMGVTLAALEHFCTEENYKVVAIYPNTDPGSSPMIDMLKRYEDKSFIRCYKNLEREVFVNVMRHARALIGNSSMGILEAPFYKFPVVNVGNRQQGREQAGNVVFVPHEIEAITRAIHKACTDEEYRTMVAGLKNPFGDGRTSEKIRDVLKEVDPHDTRWLIKSNLAGIAL